MIRRTGTTRVRGFATCSLVVALALGAAACTSSPKPKPAATPAS